MIVYSPMKKRFIASSTYFTEFTASLCCTSSSICWCIPRIWHYCISKVISILAFRLVVNCIIFICLLDRYLSLHYNDVGTIHHYLDFASWWNSVLYHQHLRFFLCFYKIIHIRQNRKSFLPHAKCSFHTISKFWMENVKKLNGCPRT